MNKQTIVRSCRFSSNINFYNNNIYSYFAKKVIIKYDIIGSK